MAHKRNNAALDLDGPLWKFALDFYQRPEVAPACLTLQNLAQVDVVHLIMVVFADRVCGLRFTAQDLSEARLEMESWRETTVLPLREIRQSLKRPPAGFPEREAEELREMVKATELISERIQIAMAERWLHNHDVASGLSLEDSLDALVGIYFGNSFAIDDRVTTALDVIKSSARAV